MINILIVDNSLFNLFVSFLKTANNKQKSCHAFSRTKKAKY